MHLCSIHFIALIPSHPILGLYYLTENLLFPLLLILMVVSLLISSSYSSLPSSCWGIDISSTYPFSSSLFARKIFFYVGAGKISKQTSACTDDSVELSLTKTFSLLWQVKNTISTTQSLNHRSPIRKGQQGNQPIPKGIDGTCTFTSGPNSAWCNLT